MQFMPPTVLLMSCTPPFYPALHSHLHTQPHHNSAIALGDPRIGAQRRGAVGGAVDRFGLGLAGRVQAHFDAQQLLVAAGGPRVGFDMSAAGMHGCVAGGRSSGLACPRLQGTPPARLPAASALQAAAAVHTWCAAQRRAATHAALQVSHTSVPQALLSCRFSATASKPVVQFSDRNSTCGRGGKRHGQRLLRRCCGCSGTAGPATDARQPVQVPSSHVGVQLFGGSHGKGKVGGLVGKLCAGAVALPHFAPLELVVACRCTVVVLGGFRLA